MNRSRLLLAALVLSIFCASCFKMEIPMLQPGLQHATETEVTKFEARNIFGAAFAKALYANKHLRTVIKNRAKERFDGTTDVLYWEIMGMDIGGKSVNEVIGEFAAHKELFDRAVANCPLLTIYVPNLPSHWNVDSWDLESPVIDVAISKNPLDNQRTINFFTSDGKLEKISDSLIPGKPTLVIKENARLILKPDADLINSVYDFRSDLPSYYKTINKQSFYFLSKTLLSDSDSKLKRTTFRGEYPRDYWDDDLYWAFEYFGTSWPRDYLYYGLTPTNTTGFFNNLRTERVVSFWFASPAILNQISTEINDPKINQYKVRSGDPSWTSGSYLLTFTIQVNAKNGIGETVKKVVSVDPTEVWDVNYDLVAPFYYIFSSVDIKEYRMNLNLLPFDISNYSLAWKISVEDTRPSEIQTYTNTFTSNFATNFSLDIGVGKEKKVGLKLGASSSTQTTKTHTIATTYSSVQLGDVVMNFSDPALLDAEVPWAPGIFVYYDNIYTTGVVKMIIYPKHL